MSKKHIPSYALLLVFVAAVVMGGQTVSAASSSTSSSCGRPPKLRVSLGGGPGSNDANWTYGSAKIGKKNACHIWVRASAQCNDHKTGQSAKLYGNAVSKLHKVSSTNNCNVYFRDPTQSARAGSISYQWSTDRKHWKNA